MNVSIRKNPKNKQGLLRK